MGDQRKPLEEVTVVFPPLLWLQNPENLLGKQRQCLQYQYLQAGGGAEPRDDLQVGVARRSGRCGVGVCNLTRPMYPSSSLTAAPGGISPSSPTISRPTASFLTVATCTPCSRSARSSGRSSWRWGEHGAGGGTGPATGHRQGSQATSSTRFTEMPTDNYIESSFWNFDALFQPQQHPARDQHDTFFLRGGWDMLHYQKCQAWTKSFRCTILQNKHHPP